MLTKNPARKLQLPITPEKHKKVSFSEQQIVDLLNASKGTCLHLEIILAITLGLRKAELWGLKFSDVDFIAREIHIQRTLGRGDYDSQEYEKRKAEKTLTKAEKLVKTDSGNRNNLLSDLAYMEILRRKAECEKNKEKYGDCYNDGGYICCTKYGDPRSKDYHWKPFKRILENAGLPDIRWHDLRHINASFLFSKHINPKAIANGIGHAKDIITSDIYIATDHVEKEAVEVVADFITNLVPLSASVS